MVCLLIEVNGCECTRVHVYIKYICTAINQIFFSLISLFVNALSMNCWAYTVKISDQNLGKDYVSSYGFIDLPLYNIYLKFWDEELLFTLELSFVVVVIVVIITTFQAMCPPVLIRRFQTKPFRSALILLTMSRDILYLFSIFHILLAFFHWDCTPQPRDYYVTKFMNMLSSLRLLSSSLPRSKNLMKIRKHHSETL